MVDALELGLTLEEFWETTPRALYLLRDEHLRRLEGRAGKGARSPERQRLSFLPRP